MDTQDARRVLMDARRVVLDWYDGEIQAVVEDPPTGHWFIFVTSILPGGRRYIAVPIASGAFSEAESTEKFPSERALMAFGGKVLGSIETNATAYQVDLIGGSVASLKAVSRAELDLLHPRSAEDLFAE